jgi:DsbC/DsbD-like thiol-disulfide interchange protein
VTARTPDLRYCWELLPMRRFRHLSLVLLLVLSTRLVAVAQPVRSETMHLIVSASVNDGTVVAGKRISLAFDITPKRGMHVYAPGKHDYQVIAISLDPRPWMKVQPTKYPASEIHHFVELNEKVEVYSKPFTLVQDLSIPATAEVRKQLSGLSSLTVTGLLTYQACDEKVCYAPAKVPVKFVLKVAPPVSPKPGGHD